MMNYSNRTVTSRPGLSQEQALESLQDAPFFSPGTKISSFRRRANSWVAELRVPKQAGPFPPSGDEESEEPSEEKPKFPPSDGPEDSDSESSPDESSDDSGPSEKGGPPSPGGDKKKEKGGDGEVLSLLHQILQGLTDAGIVKPDMADLGMAGPDDLGPKPDGPPGPPPGPPGEGAAGPPKAGPGGGRPLRPGEMRNSPGVTPVGAPAFASTKESIATPMGPTQSVPQPGMGAQNTQPGSGACPPGQQMVNGVCAPMQTAAPSTPMGSGNPVGNGVVGKVASFTATTADGISIKDAKSELEALYSSAGYKVKQIKRDGGKVHALLSVR